MNLITHPPKKRIQNIETTMTKVINISRKQKTIFSSPFNGFKLGRNCAATAFRAHIKRMRKLHPDQFVSGTQYICNDKDCKFSRHLEILNESS